MSGVPSRLRHASDYEDFKPELECVRVLIKRQSFLFSPVQRLSIQQSCVNHPLVIEPHTVVHFPLFLVMVLAAIVHVIAVHAY